MEIPVAGVTLEVDIVVPEPVRGVVLFAHGSGSSRHSPRNRFVADVLRAAGLAAVLADLLTPAEEALDVLTGQHRFDIMLLAERVAGLTDWLDDHFVTSRLDIGLFGASTGAAAALVAAAARPESVAAVVSRGGRPDLAGEALRRVRQPTLLIVGELDQVVIQLNRQALAQLAGEKRLVIVPGASHLFAEPRKLAAAARLAADWFVRHLTAGRSGQPKRPVM